MKSKNSDIEKEIEELERGLQVLDINYDDTILAKFKKYLEILYAYKNKLHLISHSDYNRISKKHFLTSLLPLPYIKDHNNVCDIGAGAGFPSVPLKILRPQINFTLFESKTKKADFLKILTNTLNLSNIAIVNNRAENYSDANFDLILVKAAGKIKKLIKTIDHLIAPQGLAIFYKSPRFNEEIKIARKEIEKRKFEIQIIMTKTALENLPLALVILKKL